jgi:hypothetical protein
MCSTCIFRPGNLMHLEEGRVQSMVAGADENGSCIPCHRHLYNDEKIQPVCRGYWDHGNSVTLRLAAAMEIVEWHGP